MVQAIPLPRVDTGPFEFGEQSAPVAVEQRTKSYQFYGGNAAAIASTAQEVILSGPSETGKTLAILYLLNRLCYEYPGLQAAIVRKRQTDLYGTVLSTYENDILPYPPSDPRCPVRAYGGLKPERYIYNNGSTIWLGGMDKPGKVLSGERDVIFVNQAEELWLKDWETLLTRTTGRAGNMPYGQLVGDCNPGSSYHWLKQRDTIDWHESRHRDNPRLFDPQTGEITAAGERTLGVLDTLTGARRKRLFLGLWAQAEGVVYENFTRDNITTDEPDPDLPIELSFDDGYIDPRAIHLIQRTSTRILVFDELYHSHHLPETCVAEVLQLCGERFGWLDAEQAAKEGREPEIPAKRPEIAVGSSEAKVLQRHFRKADIVARGGTHRPITAGIDLMRELICDSNGHRTIQVYERCHNLITELTDGYRYPEAGSRSKAEVPLDENNHGADGLRYWCWLRARRR